jgi:Response regulators consisting of a CheY-like receiver domain and a winged-helix DNA-binding domain
MNFLIVEDNKRVAHFVKKGLKEAGHTFEHADNGRDGMLLASSGNYDAIIMDRMLPGGIDGVGIIDALRKTGNSVPILILSAMASVDDRIHGLQAGGDDYLVKPFALGELLARLDALVRRSREREVQTYLVVGDLQLDILARQVSRSGQFLSLLPTEFRLLEYMMRHVNQVVTRAMLLQHVWNYDFDPQTNVIDVHISKLRQKIGDDTKPSMLKTIRNSGYMLTDATR